MQYAKRPLRATCPGCKKACKGELRDRSEYLMVTCENCGQILGVLPKYVQVCNWRTPENEKGSSARKN